MTAAAATPIEMGWVHRLPANEMIGFFVV